MTTLKKEKGGFTLIELLVVVGLIAVLASVIMVATSNSRAKGADASIKSNLHTIANQAEIFYVSNNNSYIPLGGAPMSISPCPLYNPGGTNMFSTNRNIADAVAEAVKQGNGSSCYNDKDVWSIAVGLRLNSGTSWCVDVSGTAKMENSLPASAINPATNLCN